MMYMAYVKLYAKLLWLDASLRCSPFDCCNIFSAFCISVDVAIIQSTCIQEPSSIGFPPVSENCSCSSSGGCCDQLMSDLASSVTKVTIGQPHMVYVCDQCTCK
jgi:hypothetical protein